MINFERQFQQTINEKVNALLTVEFMGGETIKLHVEEAKDKKLGEKLALLREGFKKITEILLRNDDIKYIVAASWIVTAKPGLMKKLGFTIGDGLPIAAKLLSRYKANMKESNSSDDTFPTFAYIGRDKFLELYGE